MPTPEINPEPNAEGRIGSFGPVESTPPLGRTGAVRSIGIAFLLTALILGAFIYRIIRNIGMMHTSLIFIGIPLVLGALLACAPWPKSATGGILRGIALDHSHRPDHAAHVMAAPHGHLSAAANLENPPIVLAQHLDKPFNLALHARHLDHERLRSEIDDARAEDLRQVENLCAIARRSSNFDQRQFARDGRILGDVVHIDDIFELKQARADAVPGLRRRLAHERKPRQAGPLAAPHSERIDVDVQAPEQRRHARQHTRTVFNVSNKSMKHGEPFS